MDDKTKLRVISNARWVSFIDFYIAFLCGMNGVTHFLGKDYGWAAGLLMLSLICAYGGNNNWQFKKQQRGSGLSLKLSAQPRKLPARNF